nr:hypothetical protein [Tanacetum cinerariifolium]
TGDKTNFLNWYCRQVNKAVLTQADLEGEDYKVVKAFYPDVIHLQFQIEECHKMLTDQVDWMNLEGDQVKVDVNRPPLLGGSPGHIDDVCNYDISAKYGISHLWFNRKKFYIDKHSSSSRRKEVRLTMRILSAVRIKSYSRYVYDYLSKIILRRADLQEHTIAERYFKNLYPSDFEDLNFLLLQGHLDHLLGFDKQMLSTTVKLWTRNLVIRQWVEDFQLVVFPINNNERKIMRLNEIYKFSDGTLTWILEALAYRVKEFKIKQLNPDFFRERNDIVIPFKSPRPVSPPYLPLSPPTDYQMTPPSILNSSQTLSPIISLGISPSKLLLTPKLTPPPMISPPPTLTQPSKHSSPLAINIDPIKLLFSTPPTSPQALFDTLEDLSPTTTNPPPPKPSFNFIKCLANEPPPVLAMEPPLLPLPPQLPSFIKNPPPLPPL